MSGSLFVISAPSGAGKTSLVHALLQNNPQIDLSVSYTTRSPRAGEIDGKDYHFVSRERFLEMSARGEFLESAEVYGNLYGTSRVWIERENARDRDILLEIDWQGAAQVRRLFPECVCIFVLPPSLETLALRLQGRGKDSAEVIATRLAAAREDVSHLSEFDMLLSTPTLMRRRGNWVPSSWPRVCVVQNSSSASVISSINSRLRRNNHGTHHCRRLHGKHSQPFRADPGGRLSRAPVGQRRQPSGRNQQGQTHRRRLARDQRGQSRRGNPQSRHGLNCSAARTDAGSRSLVYVASRC